MPASSPRTLLPIVVAYLPIPIIGAVLSVLWNVGATPDGSSSDMFFSGTALTPPLFLPAILVGASIAAGRVGRVGRVGSGVVAIVALAFAAGSTFNLPTDLRAAEAAGTPLVLTAMMGVIHVALALSLLYHALPAVLGRRSTERTASMA